MKEFEVFKGYTCAWSILNTQPLFAFEWMTNELIIYDFEAKLFFRGIFFESGN